MDLPYSNAVGRVGHYASRPSVPGINSEHIHPNPDPDIFNPQPDTPAGQDGDVWTTSADQSDQSGAQVGEFQHWYNGQPSVPMGLPTDASKQLFQDRMIADHSVNNYVPDNSRDYMHATDGGTIEFIVGRMPEVAGETLPESSQYLANGRNGYDQTNVPNEVYTGDPANVGRYRLGYRMATWGLYDFPLGKFGQDPLLRAYSGLTPQFPWVKTQQNKTAAPYTPNSSGATAYWGPATPNQRPSLYSTPSETALTDYSVAAQQTQGLNTDFQDDGRLM